MSATQDSQTTREKREAARAKTKEALAAVTALTERHTKEREIQALAKDPLEELDGLLELMESVDIPALLQVVGHTLDLSAMQDAQGGFLPSLQRILDPSKPLTQAAIAALKTVVPPYAHGAIHAALAASQMISTGPSEAAVQHKKEDLQQAFFQLLNKRNGLPEA